MRLSTTQNIDDALRVLPFIQSLDAYYPDIAHWYRTTVVPGVTAGSDVLLLAWDNDQLAGVALGKAGAETKLRCVRVSPDWQNTGLGLRLMERMFEALECAKPHCTVSEEMLHLYSRAFVNRYGFELSAVDKGRYRKGKLEYAFN